MEHRTRASGFASMDQLKQREIARKGGMAAHQKGTAHEFTTEEARHAGRKGGQQVSANRSHMIAIGRLGGQRSAERRRKRSDVGVGIEEPPRRPMEREDMNRQFEARHEEASEQAGSRSNETMPQEGGLGDEELRQQGDVGGSRHG